MSDPATYVEPCDARAARLALRFGQDAQYRNLVDVVKWWASRLHRLGPSVFALHEYHLSLDRLAAFIRDNDV